MPDGDYVALLRTSKVDTFNWRILPCIIRECTMYPSVIRAVPVSLAALPVRSGPYAILWGRFIRPFPSQENACLKVKNAVLAAAGRVELAALAEGKAVDPYDEQVYVQAFAEISEGAR